MAFLLFAQDAKCRGGQVGLPGFSRNATWGGFKLEASLKSEIMWGWKVGDTVTL